MSTQDDGWKGARGRQVRMRAYHRDKKANAPCWICAQRKDGGLGPIDYRAKPSSTDLSYEPDHYYPRARFPELALDLTNIRACHRKCNRARQDKSVMDPIGNGSMSWRRRG